MLKGPFDYMLNLFGRVVTLRRDRTPTQTVDVKAKIRYVKPDEMVGGVLQNDVMVVMQAPGSPWVGEIRKGDLVIIKGKRTTVEFQFPLYEGEELVGYRLICRG